MVSSVVPKESVKKTGPLPGLSEKKTGETSIMFENINLDALNAAPEGILLKQKMLGFQSAFKRNVELQRFKVRTCLYLLA